ncbi:DUF5337 family protein [Ostreiculturibacter nitratireducens]|uniref:DUF5337 family protein n=1 Tax=Ostreiculturibacter nitratireducens TaxID=3075226 RepID=UPI0031B5B824
MTGKKDQELARQGRMVAIVIAVTVVLWLGAQWLGPQLGLTGNYAFLFDFAALAAFLWALIVTYGLWQRQKAGRKDS